MFQKYHVGALYNMCHISVFVYHIIVFAKNTLFCLNKVIQIPLVLYYTSILSKKPIMI